MNSQGLKQKQQTALTPQQLLVARLLQVPISELAQAIQEEIEKNPVLEEDGGTLSHDRGSTVEEMGAQETRREERYSDDDEEEYHPHSQEDDDRETAFSSSANLTDMLIEQLALLNIDDTERTIGKELIGSMDEDGYIRRDLELIANDLCYRQGLEVETSRVEKVLETVQSLDPAGVGARNLQECLSIQLHREEHPDRVTRLAILMIDKHFEDFSMRHYETLMERLDIEEEELTEAIDKITHLDPRPGSSPSSSNEHDSYIVPDFIVNRTGEELSFTLNSRMIPKVRMSAQYSEMLKSLDNQKCQNQSEKETVRFLKEKMENAQAFVEAINQRQHTLRSTMAAILKHQKMYFLTGDPCNLRPLKQKEIAQETGLDDSTISRVVNQKYVQTEFGTFLLKEVFSQGITTEEGETLSTEVVRQRLVQMVANEDKANPLTDDELTRLLNEAGFPVARRTVAKYRELLGIPVGRLRKDLKR